MTKLILLGGGKIGSAIAAMLGGTGDYQLTVVDRDAESLKRIPEKNVRTMVVDVADPAFAKLRFGLVSPASGGTQLTAFYYMYSVLGKTFLPKFLATPQITAATA